MKRAWLQRIRGGGCQTLVMGKNPCFITFVVCHLSCLTQPLQPLQCLDFVSWGQLLHEETWAWKNVGLAGCCQFGQYACPAENSRFPHAGLHSPHGRLLSRLVSSSSRAGWDCASCSSSLTGRGSSLVGVRSKKVEWPQGPEFSWYVPRPWFLIHDFCLLIDFHPRFGVAVISFMIVGCC